MTLLFYVIFLFTCLLAIHVAAFGGTGQDGGEEIRERTKLMREQMEEDLKKRGL